MVINRKVLPWLVAGIALAAILLIVLVMVTQAAPDSAPHRGPIPPNIPTIVSYQGQVNIAGIPYSGTGYFRFAIVHTGGGFYWSNDGTDAITPTEAVTLTVVNGLFNVLLGETNPITYGIFSDSDRWLRVWFDDGAHGVQLLEPDTRLTTAPFAFQADHATTAMTATIFKTSAPNIIGDPFDGQTRGIDAVDLQLLRSSSDQVSSGKGATLSGGGFNTSSKDYSTVSGGYGNSAGGDYATILGGYMNDASGTCSIASGFRAKTTYDSSFIFSDGTDPEAFNGIANNEFAIRALGGFRHAYGNSTWWTAKVDSVGAVTFDSVGTAPGFTISDSLTVNGAFSATVLTATYATTALTATNATTATYATTALTATNATTATYATTALTATNATTATYATTALTATNATTSTYATTALTATNATTATYAKTALTATNATTATYASTVPGFIIVQLATPVIAINTTLSTVGTSTEITKTTLGIPSNAKGILYELTISDSGAVAQFFRMGPTAVYFYQATLTNQVINVSIRDNGICFTDSNGSIWYRSQASGSNTLTVLMRVWGYLQ
jgi:hypothetical protein